MLIARTPGSKKVEDVNSASQNNPEAEDFFDNGANLDDIAKKNEKGMPMVNLPKKPSKRVVQAETPIVTKTRLVKGEQKLNNLAASPGGLNDTSALDNTLNPLIKEDSGAKTAAGKNNLLSMGNRGNPKLQRLRNSMQRKTKNNKDQKSEDGGSNKQISKFDDEGGMDLDFDTSSKKGN